MAHWRRNYDNDRTDQERIAQNDRYRLVKVKGYTAIAVTDKAILIVLSDELDQGPNAVRSWIPKSQMRSVTPSLESVEKDDAVEFSLPKWMVDEKGLIYE